METLYSFFRAHPYGLVELRYIEEVCETDSQSINWNLVYLEKSGYLELDRSMDCPPYISCTTSITAKGIDLIENTNNAFDKLKEKIEKIKNTNLDRLKEFIDVKKKVLNLDELFDMLDKLNPADLKKKVNKHVRSVFDTSISKFELENEKAPVVAYQQSLF